MTQHREGFLPGAANTRIFWQAWLPEDGVRAVVVIAHGASEHGGRYGHVAARLVDERYATYAIDHRGHGLSKGRRSLIDRLTNAVEDLDWLVEQAADEQPEKPVFLLGHSMGGTVALEYAIAHQDRLSGLILSGPLAALEAAPPHMRAAARVLSALVPGWPLVEIDADLVSRDPEVVKDYRDDPLVYHGKLLVRTVAELARAIDHLPTKVAAITVPTLIMYGTADGLCPPEGSLMLADSIGASDVTLKAYEGLYHEILNEPEQDQVLDDLCDWLGARVTAGARTSE